MVIVIHSAEQQLSAFLDAAEKNPKISDARKTANVAPARASIKTIETQLKAVKAAKDPAAEKVARDAVHDAEMALAASIKALLAGVDMGTLREKYLLEGIVKTYATMPKPKYDQLTPDHQPQAALVTLVAGLKSGPKDLFGGLGVKGIAGSRAAGGVAINLHVLRHYQSRTYGTPVGGKVDKDLRDAAVGPGDEAARRRAGRRSSRAS